MSAPRSLNALQIAERLIGLGLCPVALRSPNDPSEQQKPAAKRGKTPFQRGWQSAPVPRSADDLDLTPDLNVGVRTGKTGAEFELVAADIDSEESARWAETHLPPTPVKTYSGRAEAGWRGQHWFYKRPAGDSAVGNRARISVRGADGKDKVLSIDVKADGGQVVAPGSVHGTGGAYEEVQPWTRDLLALLPTFDWAWFPAPAEDEVPSAADLFGAGAAEDRELEALLAHPKNSQHRREKRLRLYLEGCDPSYPGMLPGGAGAHALAIARFGCWGLCLAPEDVARVMASSPWNKSCHDGTAESVGRPYPWAKPDLLHKARDAAKPSRQVDKPRGHELWRPQPAASPGADAEGVDLQLRPVIEISPDVAANVRQTLDALSKLSGKSAVYVHAGHLVRVQGGRSPIHWLSADSLRESMALAAEFVVKKEVGPADDKRVEVVTKPAPLDLARVICARGSWPGLPELRRVSRLPPVTESGTVRAAPGYDAASMVYYDDSGVTLALPERPTLADARAAKDRLFEYMRVANFREEADKSRWLALLLTLATRTAYETCPLFVTRGAEQNSGKTAALVIAYGLLYGSVPVPVTEKKDAHGDEANKATYGWSTRPLVFWDNLKEGQVWSNPKVAALLTLPQNEDRELGKHTMINADFRGSVFAISGNNVSFDADMAVRAMVINLKKIVCFDTDFEPEDPEEYARAQPQALRDVYTIVSAFAAARCPQDASARPHKKYRRWSRLVQQAIVWLGMPDPVSDNAELNADGQGYELVMQALGQIYGSRPFTARQLFDMHANRDGRAMDVVGALCELTKSADPRSSAKLGRMLGAIVGREVVTGGRSVHLEKLGAVNGIVRYFVQGLDINATGSGSAQEARSGAGGGSGTGSGSARPGSA